MATPDTFEAENGNIITDKERRAIQALHRLARRWPPSLTLVSMGASLHVIHSDDERFHEPDNMTRQEAVLFTVTGIPNDGGDW